MILPNKYITLKLVMLLLLACLLQVWTKQALADDESITPDQQANAKLSEIKLTAIEKDWLKNNHTLRVAVKSGWMPIEFKLENDKHLGFSIDYLNKLANILNVEFILVNYTENTTALKADLISAISNNNLKEAEFQLLSQPYLNFPFAIYTNSDKIRNHKIKSLSDLNHLSVAIFKNGIIAKKIHEDYPNINLVYVDIADEAFEALRLGTVDAYIGNQAILDYFITVHRLKNIEKSGFTPYDTSVYMAVRKDLPILHSILDKGLAEVGQNNQEILNGWDIKDDKYYQVKMTALVLILVIFLFVLFKVYRLKLANRKLNLESQRRIWYQANFDQLTQLPNRHLLKNRLEKAQERADRSKLAIGLLYIDLDGFKKVNDHSGHLVGDKLLREVANRINSSVRAEDTVARVGGDEFIVVLTELKVLFGLEKTSQSILTSLSAPFTIDDQIFYISASIGIAVYPDNSNDPEELLNYADQAMFEAKKLGRNRFHFFTESIQTASLKRLSLANDIRVGITDQQFVLYYQPIIDLKSTEFTKAEALIRWNHPTKGIISPQEFIPIAEETGLIVELGDWVFKQAIKDLMHIKENSKKEFQLSINVSPIQFKNPDKLLMWIDTIQDFGVAGSSICIEITEGILLVPTESVINTISKLREAGIEFSIDDFGTGYSALAYLKRFHIEYVKIDKSFIQNLDDDNYDAILCNAIIDMAQKLGIKVVAEGIETKSQQELLTQFKCDYGQGYNFSVPLPLAQLLPLMHAHNAKILSQ